ncbi:DHHC palmitoyltransferase-domain-containing protein [Chytriomyces cf. hyalinus JEL632]|nr:DHHC palmitoyltransferase-domain-containing protein [Chytriomyces cf. hyalinus JEL632]
MQAFSSADHLISRGTSNEAVVPMPPLVALNLPSTSMATDPTHWDNDTLNTPTHAIDHHSSRPSNSLMKRLRWLLTRKDFAVLVAAVFLIVFLSTLFAVFSLPRLYHTVSSAFAPLFAWLLLLSLGHLARTSLTDPGFLAKGLVPMAASMDTVAVDGFRDAASPVFSRGASGSVGVPSPKLSTTDASPEHTAQVSDEPQLPANYPFISINQPSPMLRPVYQDALLATVHGVEVKVKYCYSCQIWRPPRASHCRSCDRCVENHDHHCPWTGTCIGKHNYRHFFNFILVTWLLATFVACSTIALIVLIARDLKMNGFTIPPEPGVPRLDPNLAALEMNPVLPILVVMTGMFSVALGFMVGYHIWLSIRNVTTHEDVKQKYRNRNNTETPTSNSDEGPRNWRHSENPFDHGGPWKNIAWVLCRPAESSHDPLGRFEAAQSSLEEEGRLVDVHGYGGQRSRAHWSGRGGGRIAAWRRAVANPSNSSNQTPV